MTVETLEKVVTEVDGSWIEEVIEEPSVQTENGTTGRSGSAVTVEIEGVLAVVDKMNKASEKIQKAMEAAERELNMMRDTMLNFPEYRWADAPVGYCTPYRGRPMTHGEYARMEERYLLRFWIVDAGRDDE